MALAAPIKIVMGFVACRICAEYGKLIPTHYCSIQICANLSRTTHHSHAYQQRKYSSPFSFFPETYVAGHSTTLVLPWTLRCVTYVYLGALVLWINDSAGRFFKRLATLNRVSCLVWYRLEMHVLRVVKLARIDRCISLGRK